MSPETVPTDDRTESDWEEFFKAFEADKNGDRLEDSDSRVRSEKGPKGGYGGMTAQG